MYEILENLSIGIALVPLIVALFIKRVSTKLRRLFIFLFTFEFLVEITAKVLSIYSVNNYFIAHIHTVIYAFILLLIGRELINSKRVKFSIEICFYLLIIIAIWEFFYHHGYLQINTYSYLLLSILGIQISIFYLFQLINNINKVDVFSDLGFWISAALLIYFGTTVCLTLFDTYILVDSPEVLYYIWPIQLIANIIYHLILARGIWQMRQISY